jgi:V/A-type H+-transporting ATPase subunit I
MSLRAVPMVHVRVQVPNRDAVSVTRAIAAAGLLHLVDIAHGRPPFDAAPPGTRDLYAAFRDLHGRISAVAARLGVLLPELTGGIERDPATDFAAERERIECRLQPIEKTADELTRDLSAAREREGRMRRDAENDARLQRAGVDASRLQAMRFANVRLGVAPEESLEALAVMLAPGAFVILPLAQEGEQTFFAVAASSSHLDEALRLLNIQPCTAPPPASAETPAGPRSGDVERKVGEARSTHEETLRDLARRAQIGTLLLQAQTFFATAGRFIVISGWVPRAAAEKLEQRVRAVTEGRAIVDLAAAESFPGVAEGTLRVPILHRNPLLLRPFQKLVELYGTPSYAEIQPTAFFAVGFLLMFGLMFGDVGHGVVLFCAGWFLFRYMPRFLDYGILLMEAGTASSVFGVLYGSVFGLHGLIPTIWLEPIENLAKFMSIAIVFGAVVVTAGLLLNIINSWRTHEFRDALAGPRGAMGAVLYWIVLVLIARAFVHVRVPDFVIFVLFAMAVAAIVAGRFMQARPRVVHATPWWLRALEGSIELVDTLFSFFANTISFVRVAAFAAVHAGVFIAIFALADTIARLRFGGVLSVLVHIAANALVILLEGLTVSVQVLRLEYYEFFGKFFRGGGEVYKPLAVGAEEERHVS